MKNYFLASFTFLVFSFTTQFVSAQKQKTLFVPFSNFLNLKNGVIDTLAVNSEDKWNASSGSCLLDIDGNLVYYTDGRTLWNKYKAKVENGTKIGAFCGARQHSLLIKQPGHDTTFLFTTDKICTQWPYYAYPNWGHDTISEAAMFSIIDDKGNGGKGRIVKKNIFLFKNPASKIAATRHQNGRDWWIFMINGGKENTKSDSAFVFLLSPAGLSNPKVFVLLKSKLRDYGFAKFSPKGNFLIMTSDFGFELYKFNKLSGSLTLRNKIIYYDTLKSKQGITYSDHNNSIEFDPYEQYLFVSKDSIQFSSNICYIYQYDLYKVDELDFVNSRQTFLRLKNPKFNQLFEMIRVDSFIYILDEPLNRTKRIEIHDFYKIKFISSTEKILSSGSIVLNYTPPINFTRFANYPTIVNQPFEQPKANLNIDSSTCNQRTLFSTYERVSEFALKKWSNGDTGSKANVYYPGWYWHYTIMDRDTLTYDSIFVPPFNGNKSAIPNDTNLCTYSDSIKTHALANPSGWLIKWSDNSTENAKSIKTQGLHSFVASKNGCIIQDSFRLKINNPPVTDWPKDTTICSGEFLHLITIGFDSAIWKDSGDKKERWLSAPGSYSVKVVNDGCSTKQNINLLELPLPKKVANNSFFNCFERNPIFNLTINSPYQAKWGLDGDTSKSKTFIQNGIYPIELTDTNSCKNLDTVFVYNKCDVQVFIPNVFRPLGLNYSFAPSVFNADFYMQIFNAWGQLIFKGNKNQTWDGTYLNEIVQQGNYFYYIKIKPTNLKDEFSKSGTVLLLQ